MKKIFFAVTAMFLFSGMAFGQTVEFKNYRHSMPSGFPGATVEFTNPKTTTLTVNFQTEIGYNISGGAQSVWIFDIGNTYTASLTMGGSTSTHSVTFPANRTFNIHNFLVAGSNIETGPDYGGNAAQTRLRILPGTGYTVGSNNLMLVEYYKK